MARRELPVGGADLPELSQLAPEATRVLGAWLRDVVKANPSNSEHMCQEWLEGYLLTGPAPPWTPLPPHDNTSVTPGGGALRLPRVDPGLAVDQWYPRATCHVRTRPPRPWAGH